MKTGEKNFPSRMLGCNVGTKLIALMKLGYTSFSCQDTKTMATETFRISAAKPDNEPSFILKFGEYPINVYVSSNVDGSSYTSLSADYKLVDLPAIASQYPIVLNGVRFNAHAKTNDRNKTSGDNARFIGAKGIFSREQLQSSVIGAIHAFISSAKLSVVLPELASFPDYQKSSIAPKGYDVYLIKDKAFADFVSEVFTPVKIATTKDGLRVAIVYLENEVSTDDLAICNEEYKKLTTVAPEPEPQPEPEPELTLDNLSDFVG